MKLAVVAVGKVRKVLQPPVEEYEERVRRYFAFEAVEVREEPFRGGGDADRVRAEEGARLLARVPTGSEMIALHPTGQAWTSEQLARYLAELALRGSPGASFLIGGAFGLSDEVLAAARHPLSLSTFTFPHEMARLVLTEQIYRAGTIARGEPYHKSRKKG